MDFSDTDEDSAVEELISQAKDLCVLEQLSAINCSGFTDSVLPTELESRFCKLKSFPLTKDKSTASRPPQTTASFRHNSVEAENPDQKACPDPKPTSGYESPPLEFSESSPEKSISSYLKRGSKSKPKLKHGSVSSPSNSSNSSPESAIFSPAKRISGKKHRSKAKSKSKSKSGSFSSPLGSCNSLREDSPSPPRKSGCFWCSPKTKSTSSHRKSKENGGMGGLALNFSDDKLLSDLGSFSKRELKKAMKEEEKISKEAEKIVKWAKHESARMHVTGIDDDELSDN